MYVFVCDLVVCCCFVWCGVVLGVFVVVDVVFVICLVVVVVCLVGWMREGGVVVVVYVVLSFIFIYY